MITNNTETTQSDLIVDHSDVEQDYQYQPEPKTVEAGLFYSDRELFKTQLIAGLMAIPTNYSLVAIRVEHGKPTKAPKGDAWQKTEFSRNTIANQIRSGKASGFGIKLGEPSGGIVALDVDGFAARKELEAVLGGDILPQTVACSSGKPGRAQYLFMVPPDKQTGLKSTAEKHINAEGVSEDLNYRWTGNQSVLAPSAHPDTPCYFWVDGCSPDETEIAEIPVELLAHWLLLLNPTKGAKVAKPQGKTAHNLPSKKNKGDFDRILAAAVAKVANCLEGGRNQALNDAAITLMGLSPDKEGLIRSELTEAAIACGLDLKAIEATLNSAFKAGIEKPIVAYGSSSGSGKKGIADLDADIQALGVSIRLNQMSGKVEVDGKPIDLDMMRRFTTHQVGYALSTEDCIQCWVGAGYENPYHPVVEYLRSLPSNTPAIDLSTLALEFFGDPSPLAAVMVKKKLIAAVARVMQPGCKDNHLLVLMGAQGLRKTSFIEALASQPWFTNDLTDISSKDDVQLLKEKWIIEMGEVDGVMTKKEDSELKAFLSKDEDIYRQAYKRENVSAKRTSSLWASTNKTDILQDPTGSRRYWIIQVNQKIDITQVEAMRDSIWCAALQAYDAGEIWWLTDEEEAEQKEANKQFADVDPWFEVIRAMDIFDKQGGGYITSYFKVYEQLKIVEAGQSKMTQRRIAAVMTQLGYVWKPVKVAGTSTKCWWIGEKP